MSRVAVLGAGIVGICTALSLAERGVAVRLIDRSEPGQETSYGNAGVISPWSIIPQSLPGMAWRLPHLLFGRYRPLAVRPEFWPHMIPWGLRFLRLGREAQVRRAADAMEILCGSSVDLYRRHLAGTGYEHLLRDSLYVHAFRDAGRDRLQALDYRIRRDKGAPLELVGADRLRQIEPALSRRFRAAVLIGGQARAMAPGRIAMVLADKARGLGVEIHRAGVREIQPTEQGWTIHCDEGRFTADRVVLSMGVWSRQLLASLGIQVPLVAERGYHVEFPEPGITLDNSVMDMDAKFVASSMEGGLRAAGHAEFGPPEAPPDPRREALLLRQAQSAFPDLTSHAPRFWMGRRPTLPDSLPMLGEIPGCPGLYAGFGHSHYGLMMAPKSGEVLADLLTGVRANRDLSAFDPGRFQRG